MRALCFVLCFVLSMLCSSSSSGQEKAWLESRKKALAMIAKGRWRDAEKHYVEAYGAAHKLGFTDVRLGQSVYELGDFQRVLRSPRARPLLDRALYLWRATLKPGDERFGLIHRSIGLNHWQKGQWAQAEKALRLAREIFASHNKKSVFYGETMHSLAQTFHAQGDLLKAERFHRRGHEVLKKTQRSFWSFRQRLDFDRRVGRFGPGAELLKAAKAEIAGVGKHQKKALYFLALARFRYTRRQKLEISYKQGLEDVEEAFGAAHPHYAEALLAEAWGHYLAGRNSKAALGSRKALGILEASFGDKHPDLVEALLLSSQAAARQSDWTHGRLFLNRALRLLKDERGLWQQELGIRCLLAFGQLSVDQGRFREARDFYKRASAHSKKIYDSKRHYMIARVGLYRARLAAMLGHDKRAFVELDEAAELFKESLGADCRELLLIELGRLALRLGQKTRTDKDVEAKALLSKVTLQFGLGHPVEDSARLLLARAYLAGRQYSKAEPLLRKNLESRKKYWGAEHWKTAECQLALAYCQQKKKKLAAADLHYRSALKIFARSFEAGHPRLVHGYVLFAELALKRKNFSKAEKIFKRALVTGTKSLGQESPLLLEVLDGTITALRKLGKKKEARGLKERVAKLRHKLEEDGS
jgi:tetratricopeptide (TPR) repeat protein